TTQANTSRQDDQILDTFYLISRQIPEPAGVLRQRFVDRELGAEIGDQRLFISRLDGSIEPGAGGEIILQLAFTARQMFPKARVARQRLAPRQREQAHSLERMMIRRPPERWIHRRKQTLRIGMPRPAKIACQDGK